MKNEVKDEQDTFERGLKREPINQGLESTDFPSNAPKRRSSRINTKNKDLPNPVVEVISDEEQELRR